MEILGQRKAVENDVQALEEAICESTGYLDEDFEALWEDTEDFVSVVENPCVENLEEDLVCQRVELVDTDMERVFLVKVLLLLGHSGMQEMLIYLVQCRSILLVRELNSQADRGCVQFFEKVLSARRLYPERLPEAFHLTLPLGAQVLGCLVQPLPQLAVEFVLSEVKEHWHTHSCALWDAVLVESPPNIVALTEPGS